MRARGPRTRHYRHHAFVLPAESFIPKPAKQIAQMAVLSRSIFCRSVVNAPSSISDLCKPSYDPRLEALRKLKESVIIKQKVMAKAKKATRRFPKRQISI
jgi:hypothetical protein